MKVVDHEPYAWFLFEEDSALYLDASCNHSAFSYSFMVRLSEQELAEYRKHGRSYLSDLARDIHFSAPIIRDSKSAYVGRDVSQEYSTKATAAVQSWRAARSA